MTRKIFPRNLTARADYVVAGNPTNSRPESGVDNCYPGLELDQRNLDQRFFPGLVFYFHRLDGATLIEAPLTEAQRAAGLTPDDLVGATPFYLWGMMGRHLVVEPEPSMISFLGQTGMGVWRRVHDLLPGPVAIVLGPKPGSLPNILDQGELRAAYDAGGCKIIRAAAGDIAYVVLGGERARYLTEDGVIEPAAYAPGDLTKTLCAPWMYDFRDCLCFFWASNKPDIVDVTVDGARHPNVNFMRRDRSLPPAPDIGFYVRGEGDSRQTRIGLELTHQDMVEGWSHALPVVLGDRETPDGIYRPKPAAGARDTRLTKAHIVAELGYLATVEHALTVQYLYAYYSLAAPPRPYRRTHTPDDLPIGLAEDAVSDPRISDAATQLFAIAVEEMRHFLWVNLALKMLDVKPSIGRATRIGRPPAWRKPGVQHLDRRFELRPLEPATLDGFIDVERPSRHIDDGIDGMYVHILEALDLLRGEIGFADRLMPIIKLIIDEGEGHFDRFTRIKETLRDVPDTLRTLATTPPTPRQARYLAVCDAYYRVMLQALEIGFSVGWDAQPQLVDAAIRLMQNLDDMAAVVCREGYLPRFSLRPARSGAAGPAIRLAAAQTLADTPQASGVRQLQRHYGMLDGQLRHLAAEGDPHALRHRAQLGTHIAAFDALLLRPGLLGA